MRGLQMNWISVKDRLPATGISVLVCGKGIYTTEAHNWEGVWMQGGAYLPNDVTHWMELPEPIK
jgi:hypothetical protein